MGLWNGFATKEVPETGRKFIQLTTCNTTCYRLYYFISMFASDGNSLVYHRAGNGEV